MTISPMKIQIGKLNRATGTVPVTFEQDGPDGTRRHARSVNAVIDTDGRHDRASTVTRVHEVAAGVAHKFAAGLLGDPIGDEPVQEV